MLVLKILGVILAIVACISSLVLFNRHCYRKFSHRFFSFFSYLLTTIAVSLVMAGHYWYNSSATSGGDTLNGIVVIALGALMALFLVIVNFRNTNLWYGLGGSALQLAIFGSLAQISIWIFIIAIVGSAFTLFSAQPVYVVNK